MSICLAGHRSSRAWETSRCNASSRERHTIHHLYNERFHPTRKLVYLWGETQQRHDLLFLSCWERSANEHIYFMWNLIRPGSSLLTYRCLLFWIGRGFLCVHEEKLSTTQNFCVNDFFAAEKKTRFSNRSEVVARRVHPRSHRSIIHTKQTASTWKNFDGLHKKWMCLQKYLRLLVACVSSILTLACKPCVHDTRESRKYLHLFRAKLNPAKYHSLTDLTCTLQRMGNFMSSRNLRRTSSRFCCELVKANVNQLK